MNASVFVAIFLCLVHVRADLNDQLAAYLADDSDLSYLSYKVLQATNYAKFTTFYLNVTSLKWFDENFSSASVWWHQMYINVPSNLDSSLPIYYFIDSGSNTPQGLKSSYGDFIANLSSDCSCITASIRQIPNQPIKFSSDPLKMDKTEDQIVAWTMHLFYGSSKTSYSDAILPLLFPMTKAAKRGMDVVEKFLKTQNVSHSGKFIASGVSKRGWTTFLITAADKRVVASVPIVYDVLNWNANFHNHYMSLGGAYSFALADYYMANTTLFLDTLASFDLAQLIDPYAYMEYYRNKPIMIILAASDEFMLPENTKFFWKEISVQANDKAYLRRLSNTNHQLIGQGEKMFSNIKNFMYLLQTPKMPVVNWAFANNKTHAVIDISLENLDNFNTYQVDAIYAKTLNNKRKDFRKYVLGANFTATEQTISWETTQVALVSNLNNAQSFKHSFALNRDMFPDVYTALYLQISFNLKQYKLDSLVTNSQLFIATTEMNVFPEYPPVPDCDDYACFGTLV